LFKPRLIKKRQSQSGSRQALTLIPIGSLREMVVQAVVQLPLLLARFQLHLYLSDGLMQPDERFFYFPNLLQVPSSLSRGKLNACCVVFLIEFGLPIVQNLADALRACSGDRYHGMSCHIA
jgi:hypothetical protein